MKRDKVFIIKYDYGCSSVVLKGRSASAEINNEVSRMLSYKERGEVVQCNTHIAVNDRSMNGDIYASSSMPDSEALPYSFFVR